MVHQASIDTHELPFSVQQFREQELSVSNLPGYTVLKKDSVFIDNALNAPLLRQFSKKVDFYVPKVADFRNPMTLLSVPLLDEAGKIYGVAVLFNRLSSSNAICPFSPEESRRIQTVSPFHKRMIDFFRRSTENLAALESTCQSQGIGI